MGAVSLDLASLNINAMIGKGDYDIKVYLGLHKRTNEHYALKIFPLETCELNFKTIQHEIWMHKRLKHKNILPILNTFVFDSNIFVVFPLMGFGSCKDLVHAHFHNGLPELAIAYILKDVVQALEYLHSRHIIHRSVKGSHVMISYNGNVVLSGLRHCYSMIYQGARLKNVHNFPKYFVSSLNWASRELLEQNLAGYNTRSDIYSMGILACELGNGVIPFYDMPMTQMLLNKIEGHVPALLDVTTYTQLNPKTGGSMDMHVPEGYKRTFSSHFHNFVKACLSYEPKSRPSASSLESHWFFKQTRSKNQPSLVTLLRPLKPIDSKSIKTSDNFTEDELINIGSLNIKESSNWNF